MISSKFFSSSRAHIARILASALGLLFALWLSFAAATPAVAQSTTIAPAPMPSFSHGMTFQSWQQFAGIATGQNSGGDGKGTVQTLAQGLATMKIDGRLAVNPNPDCGVACNLTQTTMQLESVLITGATATNQGVGNNPVSSQIGGNAMNIGAMRLFDRWTATPATTPGN